ncbi:MAG TPA: diguanylate cyclase [Dissulfurispiraceae bacterium]|nr:diguanylate cyclase [Dissulfurispiraceae bacterium]
MDREHRQDNKPFLRRFIPPFRLSIAKKLLAGFLINALLLILIAAFSLSNLNRINSINDSIIQVDTPLIDATERMIDAVLAQESYGKRYMILKSSDMLDLFSQRSVEFRALIDRVRALPNAGEVPVDRLMSLHTEYDNLFRNAFWERAASSVASQAYEEPVKRKQEELVSLLQNIALQTRQHQNTKNRLTMTIGKETFRITLALCVLAVLSGIVSALVITRSISVPILRLKKATKEVAEGRFNRVPLSLNQDEIGDLSVAFNEMTRRLKRLEEMYLDASPLTRLPGGIAIENVLRKRLSAQAPLAFCLLDMDNFKSFNDRYGYARGSDVILATSRIILGAVAECGKEEDFVGHIGGDDFVIITVPERYETICARVVDDFDRIIPDFYDPEDRERGYIVGKTRQGQEIRFPLITLSIAIVTNENRSFTSHLQIGEIAAELKDYAKKIPRSIYIIDKRKKQTETGV